MIFVSRCRYCNKRTILRRGTLGSRGLHFCLPAEERRAIDQLNAQVAANFAAKIRESGIAKGAYNPLKGEIK